MTTFTCPVCGREYSTDSERKSIVQSMRAYAAECEQQCRQRVKARFGQADRNLIELAALYRKLAT
jgi:transcription elongation factor Elf1